MSQDQWNLRPGQPQWEVPPPPKTHRVRNALLVAVVAIIAVCSVGAVIASSSRDHTTETLVTASPIPNPPVKGPPPKAVKDAKPTSSPKPTKTVSAEQRNATSRAVDYLDDQAFSRKGLIDQLKFEGYSAKASTAAVDSLKVDWNVQAAAKAKDYLSDQSFSRSGLRDQLEFEGFTRSQASYGVKKSYSS